MQDNDPKHTSRHAEAFYERKSINWVRTPAESPDLNPIENLWHELKEFVRREVKPHTKEELILGIKQFWKTVDVPKCTRFVFFLINVQWLAIFFRYIRHLVKVIPKVIEVEGKPTGY